MKVFKKLTAAAVCMTLMMGAVGIQASAATVTQDGLNASLTTDKTEYKKDEPITATLTVENTSGTAVKDVKLENIVPEGYELAKDYSLTKSVDELKSNDKVELTVVYNAKTDGKKTTADGKATADDSKPAAPAQSSTSTTSTGTSVETAKTGDTTKVVLIVLIIVAALVIGIICFKKKKGKQLLSIAVCASVLSTAVIFMQFNACAAEEKKTISVSQDMKVDGKKVSINSFVKYNLESENQKSSEDSSATEETEQIKDGKFTDNNKTFGIEDSQIDNFDDISKAIISRVTYKLENEKYDNNNGTADIIVYSPDVKKAFSDALSESEKSMSIDDEDILAKTSDLLIEHIKNVKLKEYKLSVDLIKKDGKWVIVVNDELADALTGNIEEVYYSTYDDKEEE